MSRWSDEFVNHPIHEAVSTITGWIGVEMENIDHNHQQERRRLKKGFQILLLQLEGIDPEFYPEKPLSALNSGLRQPQFWSNIEKYSTERDPQYLTPANDHFTTLIPIIGQIAALADQPEATKRVGYLEEIYNSFSQTVETREQDFNERITEAQSALNRLENTMEQTVSHLSELKEKAESAATEWQTEFSESQTSRSREYSQASIERAEHFDEFLREVRSKSDSDIKDIGKTHDERLNILVDDCESKIKTHLQDIHAKHAAILEIHGLVGTDGVAGGYQKGAADERNAANKWRLVAMISLVLAAAWLLIKYIIGFQSTVDATINWASIVTAASLTFVLLATAGYASRQSKIHRDTEQQMLWFALEVKAIDPFISSLAEVDQKELKKQLSERLFGRDRSANQDKENTLDSNHYKQVIDILLAQMQQTTKLVRD